MILTFQPPKDASLFDIVLNTYGSLDLLGKFILDNKIVNLNGLTTGKEQFVYDYSLVSNYANYFVAAENKFKYVTSQKFVVEGRPEENLLLAEDLNVLQSEGGVDFLVEE